MASGSPHLAGNKNNPSDFDAKLLRSFDRYVHGGISRRKFLDGAARFVVGGLTAAAILETLSPNYASAKQVPKDDRRIWTEYVNYPSPHEHGSVRPYAVRPGAKCQCGRNNTPQILPRSLARSVPITSRLPS